MGFTIDLVFVQKTTIGNDSYIRSLKQITKSNSCVKLFTFNELFIFGMETEMELIVGAIQKSDKEGTDTFLFNNNPGF